MIKNKYERVEFEVSIRNRSYRVIRNFEGAVSVSKWADLGMKGWWWQHVFSTRDGKEAILEAIDREIPPDDMALVLGEMAKRFLGEVPAQIV